MRKSILSVSIAAAIGGLGLAGVAQAGVVVVPASTLARQADGATPVAAAAAMAMNSGGIGHQLVYPYYTVQNGQNTGLSLVNHDTVNGKAVKVRFRGAANSDDVFDFTLLLSPGDVWTGVVVDDGGTAKLITHDNSCTLPATVGTNKGTGTSFVTDRLGRAGGAGTLEGYIEVLTMADIDSAKLYTGTDAGGVGTKNSAIYTASKHVSGVAPCTATSFAPLQVDLTVAAHIAALGLTAPTTGLSGSWLIIDVPNATSFGGNATAVEAQSAAGVPGFANYVLFPQMKTSVAATAIGGTGTANTGSGNWTADPLFVTGASKDDGTVVAAASIKSYMYDFPDMSTPYIAANATPEAQAAATSGVLAVTSVQNEYYFNSSVSGATDWTFSMPTRRYAAAVKYGTTAAADVTMVNTLNVDYFDALTASANNNLSLTDGRLCVSGIDTDLFGRNEQVPAGDGFQVSPGPIDNEVQFCGEASVLAFGAKDANSALSSSTSLGRNDITFDGFSVVEGWAKLTTPGATDLGLPIIGYGFQKYVNLNASPGVNGNYGVSYAHRVTRVAP